MTETRGKSLRGFLAKTKVLISSKYDNLLDLIYPDSLYCICCGNLIDETRTYSLCDHCMTHIKWDLKRVKYKDFDVITCTIYGIYERSIIFALKYDGHRYIARNIAHIMKDRMSYEEKKNYLMVPVPIHKEKFKTRGYNHTELIAKALSREMDLEYEDALERTRDTKPMRGLSPEERAENIKGSISVKEGNPNRIMGRDVLLIDDFFTTGSTGRECAEALMKGGAKSVTMLVFSRGEFID